MIWAEAKSPTRKITLFLGCIGIIGLLMGDLYGVVLAVVCGSGIATLAD